MPNMEDIRRIANQSHSRPSLQGTLNSPLCVILLGKGLFARAGEIRAQLKERWGNAGTFLSLNSICMDSDEPTKLDGVNGIFTIETKADEFIKVALTRTAQTIVGQCKQRMPILGNAKICIITSSQDSEAKWAGPLMMLLHALFWTQGVTPLAQLYCLVPPSLVLHGLAAGQDQFGVPLLNHWLKAASCNEPLYAPPPEPGREFRLYPLNSYYGQADPVFDQIFFLGNVNSKGWTISEKEQLDILMTMFDPNSDITWTMQGDVQRFFSGYVYPSELEPGADLALVWKACQEKFSREYGEEVAEPNLAGIRRAHATMQRAYEDAQDAVLKGLPHRFIHVPGNVAIRSKFEYLWICQIQGMKDAIRAWKEAFQSELNAIWNLGWLLEHEKDILLRYDESNNNAQRQDAANPEPDFQFARFNGDENKKKINEHIEELNKWAKEQIANRRVFLNNMRNKTMAELNAETRSVYREFVNTLNNIGFNGEQILQQRQEFLSHHRVMEEINADYLRQMSTPDGKNRLVSFLERAANAMFAPAAMLAPCELSEEPAPCYAIQLLPGDGCKGNGLGIQRVAGGLSTNKYYYICIVNPSFVQGIA